MPHTKDIADKYANGAGSCIFALIKLNFSATEGSKCIAYALATCLANAPEKEREELNKFFEDAKLFAQNFKALK